MPREKRALEVDKAGILDSQDKAGPEFLMCLFDVLGLSVVNELCNELTMYSPLKFNAAGCRVKCSLLVETLGRLGIGGGLLGQRLEAAIAVREKNIFIEMLSEDQVGIMSEYKVVHSVLLSQIALEISKAMAAIYNCLTGDAVFVEAESALLLNALRAELSRYFLEVEVGSACLVAERYLLSRGAAERVGVEDAKRGRFDRAESGVVACAVGGDKTLVGGLERAGWVRDVEDDASSHSSTTELTLPSLPARGEAGPSDHGVPSFVGQTGRLSSSSEVLKGLTERGGASLAQVETLGAMDHHVSHLLKAECLGADGRRITAVASHPAMLFALKEHNYMVEKTSLPAAVRLDH